VTGPFYIGIRRTRSGAFETVSLYSSRLANRGIARCVQWNRTRESALEGLRCEAGKMQS
jgi:hypothetical protein